MASLKGLYTTAEAAELLGIPADKLRRLMRNDVIPNRRIGNRWYIPGTWIHEMLCDDVCAEVTSA